MKAVVSNLVAKVTSLSARSYILISLLVVVLGAILYVIVHREREIIYSYSGDSCVSRLTLFPSTMKTSTGTYDITVPEPLMLGSLPVLGTRVCATALNAPDENSEKKVSFSLAGTPLLATTYTVVTPSYPTVKMAFNGPVPAAKPLTLALSETDKTFTYKISANDKTAVCTAKDKAVACDLTKLAVAQGEKHEITLARHFNEQPVSEPLRSEIEIIAPLEVTSGPFSESDVKYDTARELIFETSKPLQADSLSAELVYKDGENDVQVAVSVALQDSNKILVTSKDELPREKSYKLHLKAEGDDGSTFAQLPYSTEFTTSGGPKVVSSSLSASGYVPGTPIAVEFDQPLKPDVDINAFVQLHNIEASGIRVSGKTIHITPKTVDRCARFEVEIKSGIASEHGVTATEGWKMASVARCYSTEVIGYSANGQPITAYYFGNGATHVLYTGAIHGNERSTLYTMQSWINELDARSGDIPTDKTLVIVPNANPDSSAIGKRDNARNVNLNRNFPTANWEKDIRTGGGQQNGGGGESAGSEPETKALVNLTARIAPAFVVTFHSVGSLVNSNDAGSSIAVGRQYASMVGYRFIPNSATTSTFGFEMTGTYEDWLLERGVPAILIELGTHTSNHFSGHRSALWMTTK
ncbi:hypothetical protein FJZ39_01790 [Candidatus Saccharibacteria bacterium]|nr:hypothetical protein [Candidatus Saccharibacteria bacterium]